MCNEGSVEFFPSTLFDAVNLSGSAVCTFLNEHSLGLIRASSLQVVVGLRAIVWIVFFAKTFVFLEMHCKYMKKKRKSQADGTKSFSLSRFNFAAEY